MGCKKLAYFDLENTTFLRVVKCAEPRIFGVNWYDYGARFYDAALGRFHTMDPLSAIFGFQSPYCYAANNPIKFIDFMGMNPELMDFMDKNQQPKVGADGLTDKQWMEVTRPSTPLRVREELKNQYQQQNRDFERQFNSIKQIEKAFNDGKKNKDIQSRT